MTPYLSYLFLLTILIGSPKVSAPWDFGQFCPGILVLVDIITYSHGLSRYPLQTVG